MTACIYVAAMTCFITLFGELVVASVPEPSGFSHSSSVSCHDVTPACACTCDFCCCEGLCVAMAIVSYIYSGAASFSFKRLGF